MIRKAIIEQQMSPCLYRIRIPELNGVPGYVFDTPFEQLQIATVCAPPNQLPNYIEGDIVFIAYEKDEDPVIIGKLLTEKEDNTYQDISVNSLNIQGEVQIGDTTKEDLNNLSGTEGNIQEQINNILEKLNSLIQNIKQGGGGGGTSYEAGFGIDITNNVISLDVPYAEENSF